MGKAVVRGTVVLALSVLVAAAAAASAQGVPRATPEAVGMSSERLSRLTRALQKFVAQGEFAGAGALIARDGKVVYTEAIGQRHRESGAPMRPDAIFRIASQRKRWSALQR